VVELQTTSAAAKKAAASREDAQPSQEETEKMLELQQTLAHVKNELTESRNVASNEIAGMMERTAAIQAKMSERQQADAARVSALLVQVCDLQAQLEEQRSNATREHSVSCGVALHLGRWRSCAAVLPWLMSTLSFTVESLGCKK